MISKKVSESLKSSSWIRAMFEEGAKLSKIYGADKVYDFSLGNPDPEPPEAVQKTLIKLVSENNVGIHKYMNNAGFPDVREKVSQFIQKESGKQLSINNIIMTCGAAGGLNIALKSILDTDDEVIIFAPFFAEYLSYIDNYGGKVVVVPSNPTSFEPDLEALKKSITPRCKAIIINSPNNPSGVVYSEKLLKDMATILEEKEKEFKNDIYVLSDEPYVKLIYDDVKVPNVLNIFKNSMIINSFSKSLALPGERIGYVAVNNEIGDVENLINALVLCNRTLGYVNAPSLFQKVVAQTIDETVDASIYQKRRDILHDNLTKLGYSCVKPQGAFYLFPKALIEDDVEFVKHATKYNLVLVPGRGFGCPGYFRIAYCVSLETIENSLPAFEALAKDFK